ncbi:hypothetical protein Rhopal_004167-T1 [Rhodotorula paludigena]|uniref:NADH:flavin oxidoreductase/NADH oxidase N-terminal domain-containing protein n=1 Tax=Rhodotorula paludigena TaxID=86838 RepID=A0AAV5GKY9_9BASI|nr:hypothetical protein Rhopal_004167-T1 [Rhodotorula paludigena]
MASTSNLFKPVKVGRHMLEHRLAMAPLTRFRADASHVHHDVAATYYEQRGSAPGTLLITEATIIDPKAGIYRYAPGIYTPEQVAGWKKVVEAVHAKGSHIYLQLWALGRAADPEALKEETGEEVQSASDIAFEGGAKPRPLTKEEIKDYVSYYARAAKLFVEEAGGDGVEIHNANGYLLDQFLQTTSNARTDEYGGSVENRARFPLEVAAAVTGAVGADRVGIRLSPWSTFQGMKMPTDDVKETFSYFVRQLVERHPDLAYIHAVESRVAGNATIDASEQETLDFLHEIWAPRPFIIAGGFDAESAPVAADHDENTLVALGRYAISNPDFVRRIRDGIPLAPYNRDTFYLQGPEKTEGYTDYPFAA